MTITIASPRPAMPPPGQALALFLDIDGTLLHLRDSPDDVKADAALLCLLEGLSAASGGALALISGRSVAGIDALFAPLQFPAAGQHGVERRDAAGQVHRHDTAAERLADLRREAQRFASHHPELLLEDKGASLALHYRRAPHLEGEVRALLSALAAGSGGAFKLQPGKMVYEIKPAGRDKGAAIAEFMEEQPFHGKIPLFIGDDVTDEYGFAAVNRLGGITIKVGDGGTEAAWRVPDVEGVRAWLEEYAARGTP